MELGPDLITPHPEFPHPVYLVWVSRVHANRMKMLEIGALHQFGLETELARAVQKKEMQRNTFFFFLYMVLRYSASYSSWECMIEQNFLADLCIQLEDSAENEVWSFFLFLGQF